jgi:hypothetical protein
VLKPGKVREQAERCPEGSQAVTTYNNWRFCLTPGVSEGDIPPLWAPPIAGIPYEKVLEIHRRHVDELAKLPGVKSVGLREDGIHVSTSNPAVVPSQVEGLPIKVDPPEGPKKALDHTFNTSSRPLRGAVAVTETTLAGSYGTLTGTGSAASGLPLAERSVRPAHEINGGAAAACAQRTLLHGFPLCVKKLLTNRKGEKYRLWLYFRKRGILHLRADRKADECFSKEGEIW